MIELFGIAIHEPDVALTDLALAVESALFAWLLRARGARRTLRTLLVALFVALAASSLLGALFHAFFPAKAAAASGRAMWLLVTGAIGGVAAVLWLLDALLLGGERAVRRALPLAGLYLAGFMAVIAFVDDSYATVIVFYLPPLLLLTGIAAVRVLRERSTTWALVLAGLLLSFAAAAAQFLGVALHPRYFNANAVYHVVQGIALAVLFVGFRRTLP
ncbi:MAG: hypothetical protein KY466_09745 [Gemmatimonadetes bacterium]|nr:hypothetical protein [Gemmatimonadota bacterium]